MISRGLLLFAVSLAAGSSSGAVTATGGAKPVLGYVGVGEVTMKKGEIAYRKCYSCHALEPGKKLEGPSLRRILGRRIAAERGFAYSPALRAFARRHARWNRPLLDRFIADPEAVAPGTSMNFHGIRDWVERAHLIYYLERVGRD